MTDEESMEGQEEERKESGQQVVGEIETKGYAKKSAGANPNTTAFLAYLFGWAGGLVVFFMEKKNRYVRFHAIQSLLWNSAFWVVLLALFLLFIISGLAGQTNVLFRIVSTLLMFLLVAWFLVNLGVWILLMFKALKGEYHKLPLIGDKAEEVA